MNENEQAEQARIIGTAVSDSVPIENGEYLVDVKLEPMQLSIDMRFHSKHGSYQLTPQPTITAYQAMRITMLLFCVSASHGLAIDDAWKATHDETAEHWTKQEPNSGRTGEVI